MRLILSIFLFFFYSFFVNGQEESFPKQFSKINGKKKIEKIAKDKVKIWIAINQDRYSFLEKTKIGKLEYIPSECSDGNFIGEVINDFECIDNVCSIYSLKVFCYDSENIVNKTITFDFSVYLEYTDITIHDIKQNTYKTIFISIGICE